MKGDVLLAIDNGTQSVRALLFDAAGELVAKARVPLEGYTSPEPGRHEHDVEGFWTALCATTQQLWQERPELRERVAAVTLTTQRSTVVNLDREGKPLRPAIVWLDQRKSPEVPAISTKWRAAFRLAGVADTIRAFQRDAEANWIAACEPEVAERTHKFLLLSGYLTYRLCGQFVDSTGAQVGYVPFDFKQLRWAPKGDWKWQALRVTREQLPDLVPPATVAGEVSAEAAEATGIPRGTPFVTAAADKACEVLGAGCVDPATACVGYGTTATINVTSQRYVEVIPFVPPYPSALPGAYSIEVQIFRGYWMVTWFKEQFGLLERLAADREGTSAETLFERLLAGVPAGAMGLMLQPYWTPGLRQPGAEAKGAVIGFGDVHTRAHLYRAILEGLAFALREGKERIEKRDRTPITSLRVAGGGSQSDAAMQLTADVFGVPAARPHVYETSGLGAAIDAAAGLGMHRDVATAVKEMTRVDRVFEPQQRDRDTYEALYRRVYLKMYARLKPLYESIRDITGYPAD